jgi:hypothetical protein
MVLSSKPKWPDRKASIGDEFTPLRQRLKIRRRWDAIGPALSAFLEISDELRSFKEERDDLDELENKSPIWGWTCCMVGRTPDDARPSIIVHCQSKTCCERIIRAVQVTEWWKDFHAKYPAFSFIIASTAPRPIQLGVHASDTTPLDLSVVEESMPIVEGVVNVSLSEIQALEKFAKTSALDKHIQLLSVSPILIGERVALLGPGSVPPRIATIGGIILVGGTPFGLTVAHPVSPTFVPETPSCFNAKVDFEDVEFLDDSDEEEEGQDYLVSATSQGMAQACPNRARVLIVVDIR